MIEPPGPRNRRREDAVISVVMPVYNEADVFSFSTFPLVIFYAIGGLAALVFLGLSGYSLFCKWFTELAIPGWTSHVLIGSFFGALNALGVFFICGGYYDFFDKISRHSALHGFRKTLK